MRIARNSVFEIVSLVCLIVKFEFLNLRKNKNCYLYKFVILVLDYMTEKIKNVELVKVLCINFFNNASLNCR